MRGPKLPLYPELSTYINEVWGELDLIPTERKADLDRLANSRMRGLMVS